MDFTKVVELSIYIAHTLLSLGVCNFLYISVLSDHYPTILTPLIRLFLHVQLKGYMYCIIIVRVDKYSYGMAVVSYLLCM